MIIDVEEHIIAAFESQGLAVLGLTSDVDGGLIMEAVGPMGIIKHKVAIMFITRPILDDSKR